MHEETKLSGKSIIQKAQRIADLTIYAKKLSETGILSHKLAAALIYGNIAEFYTLSLLDWIQMNINFSLPINSSFNISVLDDDKTNIGTSLRKIKQYNFPYKESVLMLLKGIQIDRNEIFHNLLVPKREWNISKNFEMLKQKTDKLSSVIEKIKSEK